MVFCDANCDEPWFKFFRPIDPVGLNFCSIDCYRKGKFTRVQFPHEMMHFETGVMNEDELSAVKCPRKNVEWLDEENANFIEYCILKREAMVHFARMFDLKLQVPMDWDSEMYFCRVKKDKTEINQRFNQEYYQGTDPLVQDLPWSGFLSLKGSWTFDIARFDSTVMKVKVSAGSVLLWNGCLGNRLVVCDNDALGLWFNSYIKGVEKENSSFTIEESDGNNIPEVASASTSLCSVSHGGRGCRRIQRK